MAEPYLAHGRALPAGSSPDVLARTIAEPMSQELGQTIVVENRPGAGGNIGTRHVAKARPDGTILLTINGPMVTAPTLYKNLGLRPLSRLTAYFSDWYQPQRADRAG